MSCTIEAIERYADPALSRADRVAAVGFDYHPTVHLDSCNLCGASAWRTVATRERCGYPATATACEKCGLVVLNPRMDAAAYSRFYEGPYRKLVSAHRGELVTAESMVEENAAYAEMLTQWLDRQLSFSSGGSFLDIGGSTGALAIRMQERFGLRATVLDPSADELAQAAALGLGTIHSLFEQYETTEQFDFVAMVQTVDHLLDVREALAKARCLTRQLFLMDIVDWGVMYRSLGDVDQSIKIDHPYYLTTHTVQAYLARAGFQVINRCRTTCGRHVLYLCQPCNPAPDTVPPRWSVAGMLAELEAL